MEKIKFSIITPVYNREDCIGRCIESVIAQDYDNLEHIIVDDGSSDGTNKIIKNYAKKYNFIKLIEYKKNRGVNFARNRAIERATGDFIIILDSDDYFLKDAIKTISNYLQDNNDYLHYMFIQNDRYKNVLKNSLIKYDVNEVCFEDWLNERITGDFVHVIHASILKEYPYFEEFRLYEGINFLRFYKKTNKQLIIKEIVVGRERNRKDALTNEATLFRKNAIENEFKFIQLLFKYFERDYKEKAKIQYQKLFKRYLWLGLALSKYSEIKNNNNQLNYLLKVVYNLHIGEILKLGIKSYSFLKNTYFKRNVSSPRP